MKYILPLTSLVLVVVFPMLPGPYGFIESASSTKQQAGNDLLGKWTKIYEESEGKTLYSFPDPSLVAEAQAGHTHGDKAWPPFPWTWVFTKEQIEQYARSPDSPQVYTYVLQPGRNPAALDIIRFNSSGALISKSQAIYVIKDEFLFVSMGAVRPQRFSSPPGSKTTMVILRRGKRSV